MSDTMTVYYMWLYSRSQKRLIVVYYNSTVTLYSLHPRLKKGLELLDKKEVRYLTPKLV